MKSKSILFSIFALFLSTQAHADPLGSVHNPATSCKAIYNSGQTTSGNYWMLTIGSVSSGSYGAMIAYCDMNTDNHAGWMLAAFADSGNFTAGLTTTTTGNPTTRRGVWYMSLTNFLNAASQIAFSWTSPGDTTSYPTGDLTSYPRAFSMPGSSSISFSLTANPAYNNQTNYAYNANVNGAFSTCYGGNTPTVTLSDLIGNPISGGLLPSTMYYRPQTFAMNCNSSSCSNYGFMALSPLVASGLASQEMCTTLDFAPADFTGNSNATLGFGFYLGVGSNGQLFTTQQTNPPTTAISLNTVAIWLLM